MTQKIYFTKAGIELFLAKINKEEERLKEMYSHLAELAEVGGNQYHDNFSFEQQMRDIHMIDGKLAKDKQILPLSIVVSPAENPNKVVLGAKIVIEKNGEEQQWEIAGYGESDSEQRKIAYNTPLARSLMLKKVGDIVEVEFGGKKAQILIKKIY